MSEKNKPKPYKWNPTGLTELRVKSDENKPKRYQPEDIRSPWATIILIASIIGGFYIIITGYWYWQMPFKKYLFASLLMALGIYSCSQLIYYHLLNCTYVETTEEEITGKNLYKMKKNVLKFNEIKEMWITKRVIVIHLKDIHGNRLGILFNDEFIPVLKEILEKSENCTRIDFNYEYFIKHKVYRQISEIKPILDKRLAEIKDREMSING